MTETRPDITEEFRRITLSDRELLLHILQHIEDISTKVAEMHEELQAAKPLIERWQHSKIVRYAAGLRTGQWPTT